MAHPDEMPRATTVPVAASPDGTREQAGDRTMLAVRAFGWLAFAVAAVAFPALGNGYLLYLATLVAINVIGSIGLNITVGYAGVLSIGHSAFMGVGAYTAALLAIHLGTPLIVNLAAGALGAFLVGLIFAVPSLRIKGVVLAIATLAAQYMLYFIFRKWVDVTGGDRGLSLPAVNILGLGDTGFYYLATVLAALLCIFAGNLFRTRIGRAFIAVRERDYAATVLGIDVVRYKLLAFGLGAAYAGICGVLTSVFFQIVDPEQFTLDISIFFLAAIVVGGRASILGSVLGAAFMTLMPEILRVGLGMAGALIGKDPAGVVAPLRELIFGALIIGFLMLEPRGLVRLLDRLRGRAEVIGSEVEVA
jgi:branched-chain amino acid transport system permease protein